MNRSEDWFRQAERELQQARYNANGEYYELACFLCHQAAEKALKAVYHQERAEAWGHSVWRLLAEMPGEAEDPGRPVDAAKGLDRHYRATRDPDLFASETPGDIYMAADAEDALRHAEAIVAFCKQHLP